MTFCAVSIPCKVSYPDIALVIHMNTMWGHHYAATEVCENLTGIAVKFKDWINWVSVAINRCASTETTSATTLISPNMAVDWIDIDACR
jgi:hypothetical protein